MCFVIQMMFTGSGPVKMTHCFTIGLLVYFPYFGLKLVVQEEICKRCAEDIRN